MDRNLSVKWLRNLGRAVIALAALSLLFAVWHAAARPGANEALVTSADTQAVVQAIQDEMYDEGCQGYVGDLADSEVNDHTFRMHVYVDPKLETGKDEGEVGKGNGSVIYKFQPMGEVHREFWFLPNGLAVLGGHPQWDFPPTEPSYLTVYMGDDELCQLKHEWIKTSFTVDLKPTAQRLREAEARQKMRFGGDYRPHKRDCSFDWR